MNAYEQGVINQCLEDINMTQKTSDAMLHTNKEYVKLRTEREPGEKSTPREQPTQQMPGGRGHELAEYARWTDDELRDMARKLNILACDTMDREALISAITDAETRR